ncbi:hypothetical protein [Puniceicoccus vermicola]|uniref:Uncharacterized protein n=1 Tax=Puniceicoccus vermicola TaxID=388746 RepID=A0A7X1B116_9BACT|nr:hypothetical protein [Puniceicoccus vermicola]MBC2603653.1 hypothetical protein [Puniceicoccus vermicola]
MNPPDLLSPAPYETRAERYDATHRLISETCRKWFDSEGNWIHPVGVSAEGAWIHPPQPIPKTYTRFVFWMTMGLLCGSEEDVRLGNAILEKTRFHSHNIPDQPGVDPEKIPPFDIFVTNHSMQMLAVHGKKLDESVKQQIEFWATAGLRDYMGNRSADLQFHGFNDNMPAKATLGLILGGEYFEDSDAFEHGLWNLHQLARMLSRRGLISEYNSPTYTPFTLVNLTVISQYAKSEEARTLASQCCERIWAEILAAFHRPTGLMGGPYSRAYHFDSTAHLSTQSFLLWLALDEMVLPNPIEEFQKDPIELLHAHGFAPESLGRLAWVSSCQLTPPKELLRWSRDRQYPFQFHATAERGGDGEKYCSEVNITQYQEKDFSLGTAEGECWSQLQSEVFYFTYRKKQPATRREDVRVAYTRYLIDDEDPKDPGESLKTHGIVHTLQDKREALVLARPTLNLSATPLRRLRFCLIIPEHFGTIDRIIETETHLFLEDGPIRYAVRPLNPSDWEGTARIKMNRIENYLLLSLENYNGLPRQFTEEELKQTLNGFVFSVGRCDEETFESFHERVTDSHCLDSWYFDSRTVRYHSTETELEICYSPGGNHVRYASIKGRIRPNPVWKADGLPVQDLPFLGTPPPQQPLRFPYRHLKVPFAPEAPWTIHSDLSSQKSISSGSGWRKHHP